MVEELLAPKSPSPATILSLLLMITQCNWVSYHWLRLSAKLVCLLKKWTIKRSTTLWCKSMHNWCFSPRNQDLRSRKGADFVRSVNPTPTKGQIMPTTKVTPPLYFQIFLKTLSVQGQALGSEFLLVFLKRSSISRRLTTPLLILLILLST